MQVEASEFNAAAMEPHAARKMMAMSNPTNPRGKLFTTK
jgi:histidinol-phosphate/aromatic aminotransferase/cobyric acid decarboxylase-like protein